MAYEALYYGNRHYTMATRGEGGTFAKDFYKYYPVSGVTFDLSRKIEGDSARRVYEYVPPNRINVLMLELLICNGVYKLMMFPEMGYNIYNTWKLEIKIISSNNFNYS